MITRFAQIEDARKIAPIEKELQSESAWSQQQIHDAIDNPQYITIGMFDGDTIIGYVLCQYIFDEAEIHITGVTKVFQRKGYALQIFYYLVKELKTRNVARLFLEVRASNIAAQSLYKKIGFTQIAVRKNYYKVNEVNSECNEQKREDALIFELQLNN